MAITSRTFFNAATMVVKRVYDKTAKLQKPLWPTLFNVVEADPKRPFLTYESITELGLLDTRPELAPPVFDQPGEGLLSTLTFVNRSLGYRFSKQAKDEDVFNLIGRLPKYLAYSEAMDKEINFWNVLNQAFNANIKGADGVSLCSTVHPLQGVPGATLSNSAGTVALSPEALQNVIVNFMTLLSDAGNPSTRSPKHLWIPPQLIQRAEEIIGSSHYPYTNENRINVQDGKWEIHPIRFLTSSTAWFVSADKGDIEGDSHSLVTAFKYQHEQSTWPDPATKSFSHDTEYRAGWGWFDWRGFYGSQGS
jgi:hypothetical protein